MTDTMESLVRPGEIKALAGARALPPLMIVLYHFCDAHKYVPMAAVFGPPITKGYLWVEFFFALSGFILTHVYGGRPLDHGQFLKARLARLYPLHLATLLSMLALMVLLQSLAAWGGYLSIFDGPYPPTNTFPGFIANLLLVHSWNVLSDLEWNAASWFVSAEFFLCLIFPVFWRLSKGDAWRGAVMIAAGIAWLMLLAWNSHVGLDVTFKNGVFRGMAGFGIGVGLAMIYRDVKSSADKAPDWVFSAAQAGVLLALVAAVYLSGPRHSRADVWTAVALDALVLALAFDRGFLARFLSTRPMLRLGEWSFGIYMGQTFWMQIMRQFDQLTWRYQHDVVFGLRFGQWTWLLEPAVVLAVCIAWGWLLTKYVEKPANAWLRRYFVRQTRTATA